MTVGRSTSPTHIKGQHAEEQALAYLQAQGFELIAQNYASTLGEIDLIMRQRNLLIFVEVRSRSSRAYGSAAASITQSKQRKISRTAESFLQAHPDFAEADCRFDVIAFDQPQAHHPTAADWIQGAFEAI